MAGVASTVVRGPFLLPASTWQEESADCGSEMLAGLEWHPSSKWDLYVYGGDEYYGRAAYVGRHNAVDKIVGWALLGNMLPLSEHVLMVSGRGGFDIKLGDTGLKIFTEARYHYAGTGRIPTRMVPVTFGIRWMVGVPIN
jgi:hypothetical protein